MAHEPKSATDFPPLSPRPPRYCRTKGQTTGMTVAEANQLLASIRKDELHPADRLKAVRDEAIISLMLYNACRLGVVCATQVEDFHQNGAEFTLTLHDHKRGKDRPLLLHHKTVAALQAWIAAAGIAAEPQTPLFRSMPRHLRLQPCPFSNRPMANSDTWEMVKARIVAAGLNPCFATHSLRVTAITTLLENGGTLRAAQQLAGHLQPHSTAPYARRSQSLIKGVGERAKHDSPAQCPPM